MLVNITTKKTAPFLGFTESLVSQQKKSWYYHYFLEQEMTFWWDSTLLHFWPSTVVNGIKISATTVIEGYN